MKKFYIALCFALKMHLIRKEYIGYYNEYGHPKNKLSSAVLRKELYKIKYKTRKTCS